MPRRSLLNCLIAALTAVALAPAHGESDDASICLGAKESAAQTIAHCTSAIDADGLPDARRSAVFTRRGLAWFAQCDLESADPDLDAAIRLDSGSSWAYNGRAIVWMQKGDIDRAIADYDSAVRLKPDYAFALANRGNAWLIKGDADRALADLDAAVRLAPPQIELALTGRGKAWLAKGDIERALADFEAALKANPKYANALNGHAYARFCQGAFDAAAEDFAQEHKVRPDAESSIALVIARLRAGRDARAELAQAARSQVAGNGMPAGLALFAGTLTPKQALQVAGDRDPKLARQRICEAEFEVGEWFLVRKEVSEARRHLSVARDTCDQSRVEFAASSAELDRLP